MKPAICPEQSIRLAFDISELGLVYSWPSEKRGIHRVVETLLDGLIRQPDIDLVLTANYGLHGARLLQASQPALAAYPLKVSRYQELAGRFFFPVRNYVWGSRAKRAIWRRGVRFGLASAMDLLRSEEARLPATMFADRDIYHSPNGAIPKTLRKLPRLQKFLTIYDLIPVFDPSAGDGRQLRRALESIRRDDWLLCISHSVKKDVCDYLKHDPDRVFVTSLAASQELFRPCLDTTLIESVRRRYGIPLGQRYILSLSALDPRKNLRHLIRCFLDLIAAQGITDLSLVLVGKENPADAGKLTREFGLNSPGTQRVLMTGYVADIDLAALYSGAMMFVFPSLAEGFGLPPLEAMQCGVPVISSNATSLPEVVGDAGLMVDPKDADGLRESMLRLYGNEQLRNELAIKGVERSRQFTWGNCVAQTIDAYRAALRSR